MHLKLLEQLMLLASFFHTLKFVIIENHNKKYV